MINEARSVYSVLTIKHSAYHYDVRSDRGVRSYSCSACTSVQHIGMFIGGVDLNDLRRLPLY